MSNPFCFEGHQLPELFLLGVQKCGTTSLTKQLFTEWGFFGDAQAKGLCTAENRRYASKNGHDLLAGTVAYLAVVRAYAACCGGRRADELRLADDDDRPAKRRGRKPKPVRRRGFDDDDDDDDDDETEEDSDDEAARRKARKAKASKAKKGKGRKGAESLSMLRMEDDPVAGIPL